MKPRLKTPVDSRVGQWTRGNRPLLYATSPRIYCLMILGATEFRDAS